MAFRMAYSLLDKVAFFLNHYLALGIPERNVSFRSFWYAGQERQRGLRPEFDACDNWPLRGLFWLSKDLFENAPEFRECLEPDAQELDSVRNHAEHKYLKLHENLWSGPTDEGQGVRWSARHAGLLRVSLAFHRQGAPPPDDGKGGAHLPLPGDPRRGEEAGADKAKERTGPADAGGHLGRRVEDVAE